jgi:hypothetical protein
MLAVAGGWAVFLTLPPEIQAQMCATYGVRLTTNLLPIAIRTARIRIRQMAEVLPFLKAAQPLLAQAGALPMEPMVDPATGMPAVDPVTGEPVQNFLTIGQQLVQVLEPAFNPREDGCKEAALYLSKWFTTDEGMAADPDLIEAVGALQDLYIQAAQMRAMIEAGIQMAGMPPQPGDGGGPGDKSKSNAQSSKPGALAPAGG